MSSFVYSNIFLQPLPMYSLIFLSYLIYFLCPFVCPLFVSNGWLCAVAYTFPCFIAFYSDKSSLCLYNIRTSDLYYSKLLNQYLSIRGISPFHHLYNLFLLILSFWSFLLPHFLFDYIRSLYLLLFFGNTMSIHLILILLL